MEILGLDIYLFEHASVMIKNKKVIYIDPYDLSDDASYDKADIVLVTHPHYDHCSPEDIKKIITENTLIITVPDAQSKLNHLKVKGIALIEAGKTIKVNDEKITAVPAYNISADFHPKENGWVGFIIEMKGVKVYHAGDTDLISEMSEIETDIALLPVGGTYTMNAEEAAVATKTLKKCKIAIPMHYGSIVGSTVDAENFKKSAACEVKILL
ncbi:hypothetical protein AYK26_06945 [Euryarchaeota archaeon SM23-78]|nr:MAG: hypothetical protein AYK26_06945 [Euryarchaeota archaeon SM23-78]MBW3001506.1 MBL fold metallo-hydrolase [Candidatus Woesearchaeota archaeon]